MRRWFFLIILNLALVFCINSSQAVASSDDDPQRKIPSDIISSPGNTSVNLPEIPDGQANHFETVRETVQNSVLQTEVKSTVINLSFAGDCTLGTDSSFGYFNSFPYRLALAKNDYSYFFRNVRQVFENDDITQVNLETTLTTAGKAAIKKFRFRGEPSYTAILKEGSIEAVNIANNHSRDYLGLGFEDTVKNLEKAGIIYSGWDYTSYSDTRGIKVAFVGFTQWDEKLKEKLQASIKAARQKADLVIVSMHWGVERSYFASLVQKSLAHFCIDNGADAVIGHHPHVIQGTELYKQRYIAYSLGNFCFGGNSNPSDKDSFILRLSFRFEAASAGKAEERRVSLVESIAEVIPCSISSAKNVNDYQPTILIGKDKDRVLKRISDYSK